MSHYTTELRFICEHLSGLDESKGYNNVENIISSARTQIFDFNYPIFDNSYKSVLETKILKHYYTREICEETYGLWKLRLNTRLNEIMPYYNKLYNSELIEFDPLKDYDITKEGTREGENQTQNSGRDVTVNQASGEDVVVNEASGEDVVVNEASGSDRVVNQASGTDSVVTHGEGGGTSSSQDGGSDSVNTQDEPVSDRWDMYSDTPQGDIIAMDNDQYRYLTNARHITESGAGSNRDETKNYGKTNEGETTYEDDGTADTTYGKKTDETITHGKVTEETTTHGKVTEETTTHGKRNEETLTHGKQVDATNTEEYMEHIFGKNSGASYSELLQKFRETFLNIDMLIIRDLADLFFNLW